MNNTITQYVSNLHYFYVNDDNFDADELEKVLIMNVKETLEKHYKNLYDISIEFGWDYISDTSDKKFYELNVDAHNDCELCVDGFDYDYGNESGFCATDNYVEGYIEPEDIINTVIEVIKKVVASVTNGEAYDFECDINGDKDENSVIEHYDPYDEYCSFDRYDI